MFGALGRLAARRPWYIIGTWLVVTVLVVLFAPGLKSTTDQSDFLPGHYESIRATNLMTKAFPQHNDSGATIVYSRSDGAALSADDLAKAGTIAQGLDLGSDFTDVGEVTPSPTKKVAIVNIGIGRDVTGQDQRDFDQVVDMRDQLKDATKGTDLKAQTTGTLPQSYDQSQSGAAAEAIVMLATILLILILLGIIFRSVLAAVTPIIIVTIVFLEANGFIGIAAKVFDLKADSSLTVILGVVLFGIGTDYFLFYLFRFRELRRKGVPHKEAVLGAVERAGEAIASAGGAVIVAFMTLSLSSLGMFKSMGPALAIAVAVMLLAALTLVPAVVNVLGKAFFWPSKKWDQEPKDSKGFSAIGASLGKRPARFALASGGLLVILAIFVGGFNPSFDLGSSQSSAGVESAEATQTMEDGGLSAGATQPTPVLLTSDTKLDPATFPAFAAALAKVPGVSGVAPQPISSPDGRTAMFIATLKADPASDAAIATAKDGLRPAAHAAAPDGATAEVGGITSVFVDFQAAMNRDYRVVFPVAAIIIMLILGLVLRSLVAPWYLMLSVALGFGATLGSAVIVFQHIKGDEGLLFMLPIMIYLFVVALGTDYNILMLTRLREEAREGKAPREAAAEAVKHAGPTIAVAGLILAGTFASLMLGGNSFLLTLGFSIAFGIIISAFIMAMFFVPAITALLGHRAWWPGHADEKAPERELVEV